MKATFWEEWLLSPRGHGWPSRVGELLPRELASSSLAIDNDPLAEQPLDATGFLSLGRLDVLIEILKSMEHDSWTVAYWDGWSRIHEVLEATFASGMFSIQLPLRGFLAVETSLDELWRFVHTQARYVGPTILSASDRSVLAFTDVDWSVTYLGVQDEAKKHSIAIAFARHGMPVDTSCGPMTPLPGFRHLDL